MLTNVTKLKPQGESSGIKEEEMLLNLAHVAALRNTEYGTQTVINCEMDDPLVKENFSFFINYWKQVKAPFIVLQDGFFAVRTDMISKWTIVGDNLMQIQLLNGGNSLQLALTMDEVKQMFAQKKPEPLYDNVQNLIDEMNNAEENSSGNVEARTDDTPDAPPADA